MRLSLDAVPRSYSAISPLTSTYIYSISAYQHYNSFILRFLTLCCLTTRHVFYTCTTSSHSGTCSVLCKYIFLKKKERLLTPFVLPPLIALCKVEPCLSARVGLHSDSELLCGPLSKYPHALCWHRQNILDSQAPGSRRGDIRGRQGTNPGFVASADNMVTSLFSCARGSHCTVTVFTHHMSSFRARSWCRPLSWEDKEGLREWPQWGSTLDMCTTPDDWGYTFQHTVGRESRYYRACLIGRWAGRQSWSILFPGLNGSCSAWLWRNCDLTLWRYFKGCQSELRYGWVGWLVGR